MSVELLTEPHSEFPSLKGSCTSSSESTFVKMPHCWKAHFAAQLLEQIVVYWGSVHISTLRYICMFVNTHNHLHIGYVLRFLSSTGFLF